MLREPRDSLALFYKGLRVESDPPPGVRCSDYLLYKYKSTNTDTEERVESDPPAGVRCADYLLY
jgi:hypothetical protein